MIETPRKLKVTIFGGRHTGQGPISRIWGRTDADVPSLQPVVIYERETEVNGQNAIVAAWVLSLDPEFDYMRPAMYLKSDAFIYTFDLQSQPEKSLKYLNPFIEEVKETIGELPPQCLVGTKLDPTLSRPEYVDQAVSDWMVEHGNMPYFEVDLTNPTEFTDLVEKIFERLLLML
ncbi:MAG TPA: hypothetical protein VKK79_09415 [Candidatus Lokiarchaeia archaeon]|nr:hypothetical protein [Candidatus Lokiarchaeia archaeon]